MASEEQLEIVKKITQETITAIYPRYYPNGAIDFFRKHQKGKQIPLSLNTKILLPVYSAKHIFLTLNS